MKPNIEDAICPTKQQLGEKFATSARQYYEAVVRWTKAQNGVNFEEIRAAVEEARQRADAARIEFEAHVDSHGC